MPYCGDAHPKTPKTLCPRSSGYSVISPRPFPARLSQTSGLHLTFLTLHPSPIQTPATRTNDSERGWQSQCCQISCMVCPILLELSAALRIVDLQLEMSSAVGLCDTMLLAIACQFSFSYFLVCLWGNGRLLPLYSTSQSEDSSALRICFSSIDYSSPLFTVSFNLYSQPPI